MRVGHWMFCFRGWTLFRGEHAVVAHEVWWLEDFAQSKSIRNHSENFGASERRLWNDADKPNRSLTVLGGLSATLIRIMDRWPVIEGDPVD